LISDNSIVDKRSEHWSAQAISHLRKQWFTNWQ